MLASDMTTSGLHIRQASRKVSHVSLLVAWDFGSVRAAEDAQEAAHDALSMHAQFQRNRFAEDMRRMWAPRWLGYQLSRVAPLFFRWRGSPSVNAAFKVSVTPQPASQSSFGHCARLASPYWHPAGRSAAVRACAPPFRVLCCLRGCGFTAHFCSMVRYGPLQACGATCRQAVLGLELCDAMMLRGTELSLSCSWQAPYGILSHLQDRLL